MNTSPFLDTAENRAAHLRELSHHLRSLEWTNAARREVEHEIPELELAMAVYRRLNADGEALADAEGAKAFLTVAEVRADHLRQVSHHMHSLEWVHASLTEVENEIPELELAMAVYRRLTGETEEPGARASAKSAAAAPKARPTAAAPPAPGAEAETGPAPSFSQFAMANLDTAAGDPADTDPGANGSA